MFNTNASKQPWVVIEKNERLGEGFQVRLTSSEEQIVVDMEAYAIGFAYALAEAMIEKYNAHYKTNWHAEECIGISRSAIAYNHDSDEKCRMLYQGINNGTIKTEPKELLLRNSNIPECDRVEHKDDDGNVHIVFNKRGWLQVLMCAYMVDSDNEKIGDIVRLLVKLATLRQYGNIESAKKAKIDPAAYEQRLNKKVAGVEDKLEAIRRGTIADALAYFRELYDKGYILYEDYKQYIPGED